MMLPLQSVAFRSSLRQGVSVGAPAVQEPLPPERAPERTWCEIEVTAEELVEGRLIGEPEVERDGLQ